MVSNICNLSCPRIFSFNNFNNLNILNILNNLNNLTNLNNLNDLNYLNNLNLSSFLPTKDMFYNSDFKLF